MHRDPHERRFVAVLFADLVGSTHFAEQRDPEMVRAALTAYYERARDVLTRFGGTVEKFIGDAVMAVWGATVAHEDDAERAVRAGLELIETVARIGDELNEEDLSLRVGVLTGEASVSPATPEQGLVVGDMVNTASRLQSTAEPGTVVVGEPTYDILRGVVEFESLGERDLKGKSKPARIWRAIRIKSDRAKRTRGAGWEPPFVGRREELHLLKDALHATERSGRSRLVSVVGEAGIGKTRLAGELRKYVSGLARDVYWHDGRSPAYDQGLPFWAVGEMVRQRAGIAETDDPIRSRTKLRAALEEYVSVGSDLDWIEPRLAVLLGLANEPIGLQGEFFAAVRRFFQWIAERGPVVLVFEDFHWADEGLIDFVGELVEQSPRHPILTVTLARPDLLERVPGWGSGRRTFASAQLGPLSDVEMSDLVKGMVEGVGPDLVAAIRERANGVPLYAVEIVRMLLADGTLTKSGEACCSPTEDLSRVRVPDTVRAVVEARLDRLPSNSRSLLQDAAVLGASFTSRGLAAMSGLDPSALEVVLEQLVRRELLEFESDAKSPERGQYRFVQSMIRDVAYGRLTREERRVRHLYAAEYFASLGETELAGAVSSHLMATRDLTSDSVEVQALTNRATVALAEAADRASQVHSHAQGLAMIEQALIETSDVSAMAALQQRAARSASALALHEKAIDYARRALEWRRDQGTTAEVVEAAALLGEVSCNAFAPGEAIEVLEPLLQARSRFEEASVVSAGAQLARAYLMHLRDADAAELADRVIEPAERLGLVPTIIDTLITRGTALGNLGRLHEAIALLEGASRFAEEHDLPVARMRAANNVGHLLAYDDHAGAMEACRLGMEEASRLGDVGFNASFAWAVAAYLDRDGRYREAQQLRDDVRDRFELPAASRLWYKMTDLTIRVERGDSSAVDPAYEAVRRSTDDPNPQSRAWVPLALARLDLLTGEFESAYTHAMGGDKSQRFPDHLALATIAAALQQDLEKLRSVAAAVAAEPARGRMVRAIASTVAGARAALEGNTDTAVARFTDALRFRYLRLDRANLQGLFATLVGRDNREARTASDDASATFVECGAVAYLNLYSSGLPPLEEQRASSA
ncbi:MAG: adenylate/guanylate cyclase domain-containing protein [Acidimicrobiia bacterium]|nr:adenylate/guanylate cyclase domain-containing protein [Acidimicrobiia bacterium]